MTYRTRSRGRPSDDAQAWRFNSCAPAEYPASTMRFILGNREVLVSAVTMASIQSNDEEYLAGLGDALAPVL